jgi:hypothetical protein
MAGTKTSSYFSLKAITNEPLELGKYNMAHGKIIITTIYHKRHNVCKSTITNVVTMCNLAQTKLSREQINTLNLGFYYAIKKDLKHFINFILLT